MRTSKEMSLNCHDRRIRHNCSRYDSAANRSRMLLEHFRMTESIPDWLRYGALRAPALTEINPNFKFRRILLPLGHAASYLHSLFVIYGYKLIYEGRISTR